MGLILLVLAQDLRTVVIDAMRDRMSEDRAKAVADAVVAELGAGDVERLLTHPATRRSFDAMLRGFGGGATFGPEKGPISRHWNDRVFELALLRLPLKQAAAKLAVPPDDAPPRALARAIEKALEPSRDFLSDERLVARLVDIGGFRDAETLHAALVRAGETALAEYSHRIDTPPWPAVDVESAVKHVQNYVAEGKLKAAVDRLQSAATFDALVRDLYLGTFPVPQVKPDPREQEVIDALNAMREEMMVICRGTPEPPPSGPYIAGNYRTQQTMTGANRQAWMMDPEEVNWALANQEVVLNSEVTFGQAQGGLRITWVKPGSIAAARGFTANDVVIAVNGITVASVEDIRKLKDHPSFQNPSVVSVKVNRAGQDVYLTYSIPRSAQR